VGGRGGENDQFETNVNKERKKTAAVYKESSYTDNTIDAKSLFIKGDIYEMKKKVLLTIM